MILHSFRTQCQCQPLVSASASPSASSFSRLATASLVLDSSSPTVIYLNKLRLFYDCVCGLCLWVAICCHNCVKTNQCYGYAYGYAYNYAYGYAYGLWLWLCLCHCHGHAKGMGMSMAGISICTPSLLNFPII